MKYTAVVLALAATVFSQSIADLPTCSISCLTSAVSASGCGLTDYTCQCGAKKDSITASVTPCIQKACSADDQAKVLSVTNAICAANGGSSSSVASATSAIASMASSASSALSSSASSAASAASSAASAASSSASAAATQSSSAAGGRLGAAGALVAAAGLLAL